LDTWRVSGYDEETLDKLLMHLHHCNNSLLMHIPTHGETLYRMAQEKCETIRQRFRSRSNTPVKTPVSVDSTTVDDVDAAKSARERKIEEEEAVNENLTVVLSDEEIRTSEDFAPVAEEGILATESLLANVDAARCMDEQVISPDLTETENDENGLRQRIGHVIGPTS